MARPLTPKRFETFRLHLNRLHLTMPRRSKQPQSSQPTSQQLNLQLDSPTNISISNLASGLYAAERQHTEKRRRLDFDSLARDPITDPYSSDLPTTSRPTQSSTAAVGSSQPHLLRGILPNHETIEVDIPPIHWDDLYAFPMNDDWVDFNLDGEGDDYEEEPVTAAQQDFLDDFLDDDCEQAMGEIYRDLENQNRLEHYQLLGKLLSFSA